MTFSWFTINSNLRSTPKLYGIGHGFSICTCGHTYMSTSRLVRQQTTTSNQISPSTSVYWFYLILLHKWATLFLAPCQVGPMPCLHPIRVEEPITNHLRGYMPYLEKYKVVQIFFMQEDKLGGVGGLDFLILFLNLKLVQILEIKSWHQHTTNVQSLP